MMDYGKRLFRLFIFLSAAAGPLIAAPAADTSACSILFFMGDVRVKTVDDTAWVPAEFEMSLSTGSKIKTMAESRAELILKDGSRLNVEENSLFEITDPDLTDGTSSFMVRTGKVAANIKKLSGGRKGFAINTPTAVAAIRGTKFTISFMDGRTVFKLIEGKVDFKPAGTDKIEALRGGQSATVGNDDSFEVSHITAEDVDEAIIPVVDVPATVLPLNRFVIWPENKKHELAWEFAYDLPIKVSFNRGLRVLRIEGLQADVEGDFTVTVSAPDGQKATKTVKISVKKR